MKFPASARQWGIGFLLSFASALALNGPEYLRSTLVLFPVAFALGCIALWAIHRFRVWRNRRRLHRAWREMSARSLSILTRPNRRS